MKYGYILTEAKRRGLRVPVFVCGTVSGLIPQGLFDLFPAAFRRLWLRFELRLWRTVNDVAHLDVHTSLVTAPTTLPLIVFSWKNCEGRAFLARRALMAAFSKTIVNLSHYFVNTAEKAKNAASLPNVMIWSESDIAKNPYFLRYWSWYDKPVMVVPFCVAPRFVPPTGEDARLPKGVATGSFHFLPDERPRRVYEDFMRFWGATTYHYLRNDLYQRRNEKDVGEAITILCSPYREKKTRFHWLQRLWGAGQKKYFSVDIVQTYQTHRFAVVGEERSGNPGIGIFEAMACGAVPIVREDCYYGLGFEPGVNCLTHRGDVESLLETLSHPLAPEVWSVMSQKARSYVEARCGAAVVWEAFMQRVTEAA